MRQRAFRALAAGLGVFVLAVPVAQAHVTLVGSTPADATSLEQVPRQVELRFNEALSSRFRQVELLDTGGHVVKGTTLNASADGHRLVLTLPAKLARGAYEVTWEALSADDGHVSGGAFVFGAGAAVGPPPRSAPATDATTLDAALRWAVLSLLLFLIGAVVMALVLTGARFGGADPEATRWHALGRVTRPLAPAAGLAALVGLGVLAREATTVPGDAGLIAASTRLLGERWGVLWAGGEVLMIAVALLAVVARRDPERRAAFRLLLGMATLLVGVCALRAMGGHAAVVPHPALHVIAAAAHLLGAGIWLGGVVAFTVLLWPVAGQLRPDARIVLRGIRGRFSWLAGGSLVVAAFTGLVAAGAQVASIDALRTTSYGDSLIIKVVLMLVAASIGLVNAILLLRMGREDAPAPTLRVPRLMAIEAALGVCALLAAGQLTASAPARGPEFGVPRPVHAPLLARQVQDVLITTEVRPNRVGTNVITVTTPSTRRGLGSPVKSVVAEIRPKLVAAGVPVRRVRLRGASDRWTAGTQLNSAGDWTVSVVVLRADGARLVAPLAWKVEPADRVLPVKYSARRIGPIATTLEWLLAGAVLLSAIAIAVRWWLRRGGGRGTLSGSFGRV